jgi:DNA repair protein RadC
MNVKLTKNEKIRVQGPTSIHRVMRQILLRENEIEQSQEHCWVIGLAHNQMIIYIELISLGSLDETIVKPMQVFRLGIMKGAAKIVLVHNHPLPDIKPEELKPSESDNNLTDRMIQVGKIVDVELADHLIISPDYFYSYQKSGMLDVLKRSKKWVPRYEEEMKFKKEKDKIREEAIQLGMERGRKEGKEEGLKKGEEIGIKKKAIEMAMMMKKKGESVETIAEYTGLSKEEIEKI